MATGSPTHFKWQHRGSITHSTLLHMRSKLVVLGEYWFLVMCQCFVMQSTCFDLFSLFSF